MDLDDLAHWMPIAVQFQKELNEAQRAAAS